MSEFTDRMEQKELNLVKQFEEQAKTNQILKKHNIGVYDGNKEGTYDKSHDKPVSKVKLGAFKAGFFILIIVIAAGVAGFLYISFIGGYKSVSQLVCGANTCPTCPSNPCECKPNIQLNASCPVTPITLYCGNQT